jgi:hypothetical protein
MPRIPKSWFNGPILVRDLLDATADGAVHAAAPGRRIERAYTEDKLRMIRSESGEIVGSTSQIAIDLEHDIPMGSLVTIWPGSPKHKRERTSTVIRIDTGDRDGLLSHRVLFLA